ncbi:MAG: mvaS [Gammaproteobacteria bacterium]|jgi:hydroxymethylglutaryl-CoA synthase|nr:mvaS [Gammaproteobacteria bacterium]
MLKVGIDAAAFFSSHYYLDLRTLAEARGAEVDKFNIGLGQHKMAVSPPDEDIVTLAANAAQQVLQDVDTSTISMLLFATESGIDQSKAAGLFVHHLLKLSPHCRIVELKQACYSATAGLHMALAMIRQNPSQKILLIASDIARYGLNTSGESSQGGGAVALLLSASPRLVSIEPETGVYCEDAMDFWRPNYRSEALVDGKHSVELYLKALREAWLNYQANSNREYSDHQHFIYHIPFPRLAEKAHQKLALINGLHKPSNEELEELLGYTLRYGRIVGNCYTASLYLGLISLLEYHPSDLSGNRIGFYSYGSGCVGEFFSGVVELGYQKHLHSHYHNQLLESREALSAQKYEEFYTFPYPTDGSTLNMPQHETGQFRLASISQHKRIYKAKKS